MGTIRNGGNGAFSGKAGSFIGSNWKNVSYIKGIPRLSKKPATQKQLEQRMRFALALGFLTQIRDLMNTTYKTQAGDQTTGMNMALQNVLNNAIVGTYPDLAVDPQHITLSKGSLKEPLDLAILTDDTSLTLNWFVNLSKSSAFADDKLYVLIYHPGRNVFLEFEEVATRGLGTVTITLPNQFVNEPIGVYAFFRQRDNSRFSKSVYVPFLGTP